MIGHQMIGELTNHLWQSTVFAFVVALLTLTFRKNRAHVRYWLWFSASVKFLVPFALLMSLGNSLTAFAARKIATELAPPAVSLTVQNIAQPFTGSFSFAPSAAHTHAADWILIAIFGVWICGFLGVALVRFRGWLRIRAAVRASTPIDIQAAAAVRSSPGLLEPGVVGILHPVLLLPRDILKRLSPSQLEAVLAHELSHIRRLDNLTAAIHMVVEAVFWFHPFVWWIGARLIEERERACDEAVLSLGGEPRDYADAIVSVCKLYVESPLTCVSGISGADLKKRIVRIMACHMGLSMSPGRKLLLGAAGLLAVAVPVVFGLGQAGTNEANWERAAGGKMAFDVASVKENKSNAKPHSNIPMGPGDGYSPTGGRFVATDEPLYTYIDFAYKLTNAQVIMMGEQAPHWIRDEHFDIQAETEAQNPTKDQMRLMVQSLLEDRFKLVVRREIRQLPTLGLVLVKSGHTGPQLKPHSFDSRCPGDIPTQPVWTIPPTTLLGKWPAPCGTTRDLGNDSITVLGARNVSMNYFADTLNGEADGTGNLTIVDKTGLQGNFDLVMEFAPESPDSSGGTFLEALKDQLGLKLIKEKDPVDCFIIDHIEQPSPN